MSARRDPDTVSVPRNPGTNGLTRIAEIRTQSRVDVPVRQRPASSPTRMDPYLSRRAFGAELVRTPPRNGSPFPLILPPLDNADSGEGQRTKVSRMEAFSLFRGWMCSNGARRVRPAYYPVGRGFGVRVLDGTTTQGRRCGACWRAGRAPERLPENDPDGATWSAGQLGWPSHHGPKRSLPATVAAPGLRSSSRWSCATAHRRRGLHYSTSRDANRRRLGQSGSEHFGSTAWRGCALVEGIGLGHGFSTGSSPVTDCGLLQNGFPRPARQATSRP